MRRTALLRAYSVATRAALPFLARRRARRLAQAGVAPARLAEVRGVPTAKRPKGRVLWVHAASVGESLSMLPVLAALLEADRSLHALVTTVTPTSAALMAGRLPPRAVHQFAPLDAPGPARRFLAHWQPDAALFVEAELWPNLLALSQMPAALIGARMSPRSLRRWAAVPATACAVLNRFALIVTQNADMTAALSPLTRSPVETGGNLKALSGALPVDAGLVDSARADLAGRPAWIAASTHPGEEAPILAAHRAALEQQPELCLILVPRHPERRAEVTGLITAHGLSLTTRSAGQGPTAQVWLVDTLGELGSLYLIAPLVLLGGALTEVGGHNPFEVAHAGAALMTGPHTYNFAETYAALDAAGAVQRTAQDTLARDVTALLADQSQLAARQSSARAFAAQQNSTAEALAHTLRVALSL